MDEKVKTTEFENVYYYKGWYILVDEKHKMYYIAQKSVVGSYNGSKELALDSALKDIDVIEQDRSSLYENLEHSLCKLVKTDLTRMVYNSVKVK